MSSDSSTPFEPDPAPADSPGGRARHVDELVEAVRRYRNAEGFMRGQSRDSMHLGKTDMTALRLMLHAGRSGHPLSAAALARELEISTAATTVLIDRLEKSGHAERRRSPTDGRVIEIWPTAATDDEVRSTMGVLHERMMAIAGDLSPEECCTIERFLAALGAAMATLEFPSPAPADRQA
ncbi:MarR family transcriptional regulator [Arthrobacter sp. MN05-02]|nr:MarR family transcriptional regulator [Arthrobacter sp. MN05-02]